MLSQLTYQQKTIFIIIGGLLVFYFGYSFSIKPTLQVYKDIDRKDLEITTAQTAPENINKYQKQIIQLEKKVGKTSQNFDAFQKDVLSYIIPFADQNNIKINEMKVPHFAIKNSYEVQTLQIESMGTFNSLTRLLDLVQNKNVGRVCSAKYELKKDNKLKRWFLYSTIFIQNYKAI